MRAAIASVVDAVAVLVMTNRHAGGVRVALHQHVEVDPAARTERDESEPRFHPADPTPPASAMLEARSGRRVRYIGLMKHFALIVIVASCGKGAPASGSGSAASVTAVDPFVGASGVVVTSKDVLVDGKSLGTLPSSLVADRTALVDALAKRAGSGAALAYTDDASAEAVVAALRGFGELAQRNAPPEPEGSADESGGTGTAMALDEGKMGKHDADRAEGQYKMTGNKAGDTRNGISISAMVGGKPTELCRVTALPAPKADDDRVELTLQLHRDKWIRTLSRVNEVATLAPHAQDLERDLAAQKASAFFEDRDDIELAAAPDVTGADLTPVIATQCKVGFRSLRAMTIAEITAQVAPHNQTTYSLGHPEIVGHLEEVIIRRYIRRNVKQIAGCYEHELATKPTLAGIVTARFTIAPDGKVPTSSASGVDPAVASCVADAIKQIEFPKPTFGKVDVTYPITFHPVAASP